MASKKAGDAMKMPPEVSLELATMNEILDELDRRYDSVILCTVRRRSTSEEETFINWRGGSVGALGLAERARRRVNEYLDGGEADTDDD